MGGLIPVLFAVTPGMHTVSCWTKTTLKRGTREEGDLFHLEEIVVWCGILQNT